MQDHPARVVRVKECDVTHATVMAAHWLALGNAAAERGDHVRAERHYERSQKWHDKMNVLLGNGDGSNA